ncbi:hypothetical protein SAMN04488565_1626 [Leucobacter chromiiresistens]|uniref:Uncharacterized protein n=1 Tax=Leucobacter chromiiresistens TaxID=1079994 RepID=A0A1H0ZCV3_9MICO|nr:hypothetical protein SAMN04488565_0684 [Leucobacter chromiiresistens]SDQ25011.1 hypothetical protein SAMN04488565_1626 [Leucobacter chromiiresistens]
MGHRTTRSDPFAQDLAATNSQNSITVGQEKASLGDDLDTTNDGGLLPSPRDTNLMTKYS